MSDRKQLFREAYGNLDFFPLIHERELEKFQVPYGEAVLDDLEQLVEDDISKSGKIIFTGHRGCGKSTLLAKFSYRLSRNGLFPVMFSIADLIELSDVDHISILFAIALNLMLEAEAKQVEIHKSTKEAIETWFAKRTRIEVEAPISAEVSGGFDLFGLIKGRLKSEASVREELRLEFERKVSDLVAQINIISAQIQASTNQDVVVIIDDLDKLDLGDVRVIFKDHIKSLFLPNIHIIFTIPIASLRETSLRAVIGTETNNQIVTMPVTKLFHRRGRHQPNPTPTPESLETLCAILQKRISGDLLAPDIAQQIVMYSGGVLRELIRLTNFCCRICLRQIRREADPEQVSINATVLDQAVKELRLDFETQLGKADYEILQTTYEKFEPDDPKDQKFLDLLHSLHVLEYRNAEIWYDTHPIVTDLLKLKDVIDG